MEERTGRVEDKYQEQGLFSQRLEGGEETRRRRRRRSGREGLSSASQCTPGGEAHPSKKRWRYELPLAQDACVEGKGGEGALQSA